MQTFVNANASFSFTLKNQPLIPSTLLQASACALGQSSGGWGGRSLPVSGSQFTASGLILVGLNTNFKSWPKECLIHGSLPVFQTVQTSTQILVWEEPDLHLKMHFLLWEVSGQCGMKKYLYF